ncbi:MAG TPA: archaemetzincin family Zn-dependent metalloprotease [Methanolinea sp.]|nr:archaemetzincin family Zn-dependent metalloprotease [Methanolinea sp.]
MAECQETMLVPIGKVDPMVITWLKEDLPKILSIPVTKSPPLPLNPRHFFKERNQYLADGLLADLTTIIHDGNTLSLGITGADIYTAGLNFVFGIATTGSALISTFRLRPETYGMSPNPGLYRWRILTEAVHELGHAIGLPHCEYPGCVMFFSNSITDTDRKGPEFCFRCRRRIEWMGKLREG